MADDNEAREAFDGLFADMNTVEDMVHMVNHAFDELMEAVDATEDQDDSEAAIDLTVAAVGSVGVALRVLAKHLEDSMKYSNPGGLGTQAKDQ